MDYNVVTERLPNNREVLQMIEKRQQTVGAFFKKRRKLKVFLIILLVIIIALAINFFIVRHIALKRFEKYEAMSESTETSYGKISYIDKGNGEPFLIFHGITGGYDQGFDVMGERTDTYRVIAPSRFGYPGSDLPENATVDMQAEAFAELLDKLGIEKTFVTATSAGGTVAQSYYDSGLEAYRQQDYAVAIAALEKACLYDKTNADALYYLGVALYDSGDVNQASEKFHQLINEYPDGALADKARQRLEEIGE